MYLSTHTLPFQLSVSTGIPKLNLLPKWKTGFRLLPLRRALNREVVKTESRLLKITFSTLNPLAVIVYCIMLEFYSSSHAGE